MSRMWQQNWDVWSFYDFKSSFQQGHVDWNTPSWVPDEDMRRLEAYKMLDSYYRNAARFWLGLEADDIDRRERREYGDPFLIVESIRSSVIGNDQNVSVKGAVDDPEGPEADLQDKLLDWIEVERFQMKVSEAERDAVRLGDSVYILGWDSKKKRVRVSVCDPGFYFPVLKDGEGDLETYAENDDIGEDFPSKVHTAWEFKRKVNGKLHTFVRRVTWELLETETPVKYAWNDDPSESSCFKTDAEWDLDGLSSEIGMLDLSLGGASRIISELEPLNIDFIPVVHIPNTISENAHFGTSSLANVMQIFDDMASVDTDLQAASGTTGTPPLALSGASGESEDLTYGPGTVFKIGDGKMDVLDTSKGLDALLKYRQDLSDRLSINSRTPRTLLGAVDPSKVPSGIVLTLSFSPHSRMVGEMRLIRKQKYNLILRMVGRFMLADGQVGQLFPAQFVLGSYLPADKTEAVNIVVQALAAHAMSLETALKVLMEAGIPIDDAAVELERIVQNDFESATAMLNATADMNIVRQRLGLPELTAAELAPPQDTTGSASGNPGDPNSGGGLGQDFGSTAPFAL